MKKDITYVFDFDKTIVSVETLDMIAELNLKDDPHREIKIKQIHTITEAGMMGTLCFSESLQQRIALLSLDRGGMVEIIQKLKHHITPSMRKHIRFFEQHRDSIYVVSGGFMDYIVPVVQELGIRPDHVYGNTFTVNAKGRIVGYDAHNPLVRDNGKTSIIRSLHKKNVVMIGDGYTDLLVKKSGVASCYVAYVEHIQRKSVLSHADAVVHNFDEFMALSMDEVCTKIQTL